MTLNAVWSHVIHALPIPAVRPSINPDMSVCNPVPVGVLGVPQAKSLRCADRNVWCVQLEWQRMPTLLPSKTGKHFVEPCPTLAIMDTNLAITRNAQTPKIVHWIHHWQKKPVQLWEVILRMFYPFTKWILSEATQLWICDFRWTWQTSDCRPGKRRKGTIGKSEPFLMPSKNADFSDVSHGSCLDQLKGFSTRCQKVCMFWMKIDQASQNVKVCVLSLKTIQWPQPTVSSNQLAQAALVHIFRARWDGKQSGLGVCHDVYLYLYLLLLFFFFFLLLFDRLAHDLGKMSQMISFFIFFVASENPTSKLQQLGHFKLYVFVGSTCSGSSFKAMGTVSSCCSASEVANDEIRESKMEKDRMVFFGEKWWNIWWLVQLSWYEIWVHWFSIICQYISIYSMSSDFYNQNHHFCGRIFKSLILTTILFWTGKGV